ncbi:MAG: hypothetical protein ACYS0I_14320 [Planctomycetota bacterium]|jgi:hypothetical protein
MNRVRENRLTSLLSHTVTMAMMRTVLKSNKKRFIAWCVTMLAGKEGVP